MLWLILVLITLVFLFLGEDNREIDEGFYGGRRRRRRNRRRNGGWFGWNAGGIKYCRDCDRRGDRGINSCLGCNNCGWCVDPNGYGSCVQGDQNGPYFADCAQYYYNGGMTVSNPRTPWFSRDILPMYERPVSSYFTRRLWRPSGGRRFMY